MPFLNSSSEYCDLVKGLITRYFNMADVNQEGKAVFAVLRPLCVQVMSSLTSQSLSSLRNGLQSLPNSILPAPLLPYLLLPLRAAIKRVASSDARVLEDVLLTASMVLSRARGLLESWEVFQELLTFLCILLDAKLAAEAGIVGRGSEALLVAAVATLTALLLSPAPNVQEQLFSAPVPLGHCVSVLLSHASNPASSHSLRAASLSTLSAVAGLDVVPVLHISQTLKATPSDSIRSSALENFVHSMEHEVGEGQPWVAGVLASFLPGLCSAITRLISTDANTVSPVVCQGLITWAQWVGVVMSGEAAPPSPSAPPYAPPSLPPPQHNSLLVQRSEEWIRDTAARLQMLVQHMHVLVTSDAWKTRLFLVGWAHSLLTHCHSWLAVCVPQWLEVLVILAHDSLPHVSAAAQYALQHFPSGGHTLSSLLGAQLHTLVSSLPRLIRHHDDTRKVATLQLLAGYLQLAGGHVMLMTHSLPHLTRLVQALLQALTLERQTQHVLAMALPTLSPLSLPPLPLHLPHTHFNSDKVAALLKEVCHLLGCHGDFPVLLDYIMDQFHGNPSQHNELLLLLSYLLPGGSHKGCSHGEATPSSISVEEMYSLVEGIVSSLVTPEIWLRPSDSTNSDHLQKFLLIHAIFTCVHVLGVACDALLQQLLYPLMIYLQDDNVGVATAAMETLQTVSYHCNYESVADLIGQNADYLVHTISAHLRTRHLPQQQQPQAIKVLQSVVTHGDEGVCQLVRDILDEILLSLDVRQLEVGVVWEGLSSLAQSCARWVDQRPNNVGSGGEGEATRCGGEEEGGRRGEQEQRKDVGMEAIAEFFSNYHKEKKRLKEEGTEEGMEEGCGGEEDGREEGEGMYSQDKQLPCCEGVCVEVMRRSVHHLSHSSPNVRLRVLDAVQHCLRALQHHKLALYPEVHLLWAPLLPRLSDSSHPVARKAWQVIMCMSSVSGDFLRKRVLDKVWPLLVQLLETMATASLRADNLYKQSGQCKLQVCLLHCVGELSTSLSLPSLPWQRGVAAVLGYLHDAQPRLLQDTAMHVARQLIKVDADKIWLMLNQLSPPTSYPATPPGLKPYKFPVYPNAYNYSQNVDVLLPHTFSMIINLPRAFS